MCAGNLGKLNRLLRILDLHAREMGLAVSSTDYRRWGRGKKHLKLQFSKSGEDNLEAAYARHYRKGSSVEV